MSDYKPSVVVHFSPTVYVPPNCPSYLATLMSQRRSYFEALILVVVSGWGESSLVLIGTGVCLVVVVGGEIGG